MRDEPTTTLTTGPDESIAVRNYLEAPERGLRLGGDSARDSIETRAEAGTVDLLALEGEFVAAAHTYGKRQRICHAAWREVGVDDMVLRRAGITDSM